MAILLVLAEPVCSLYIYLPKVGYPSIRYVEGKRPLILSSSSSRLQIPGRAQTIVTFSILGLFLASNLHGGRIKRQQSLKTFPFSAIERLCSKSALPKRSKVNLATWPETQITSTPGGRQSFAPMKYL